MCDLFIDKFVEKCLEIHKPNHYELMFFAFVCEPYSLGSFDCYDNNMPEKMIEGIDFFKYPTYQILIHIFQFVYNSDELKLSDNDKIVYPFFTEQLNEDFDHKDFDDNTKNLIKPCLLKWLKKIHETIGLIAFFKGKEVGCGEIYLMEDNSRFFESYSRIF